MTVFKALSKPFPGYNKSGRGVAVIHDFFPVVAGQRTSYQLGYSWSGSYTGTLERILTRKFSVVYWPWQSSQSGISLHRMHLCKQAEAAHLGWQLVEWIDLMKLYIHVFVEVETLRSHLLRRGYLKFNLEINMYVCKILMWLMVCTGEFWTWVQIRPEAEI